jgi:mRNA-degrading endonuclease RelE of RelBE toxin-antitoxin system
MPWRVEVSSHAQRDLQRLPRRDREAVIEALRRLGIDPGAADMKKLGGRRGEWRLRVGRWRVLLDLDNADGLITVSRIVARKDAY